MMGRLIIGDASLKNISGPVTIAEFAGKTALLGLSVYLGFLAIISVSLGVLNLLPIPMLDGGHLLYYIIELLSGKPVPESVQEVGFRVGIALVGTMMLLALYNDIVRLIN
jgi:regulator of sigma E protease